MPVLYYNPRSPPCRVMLLMGRLLNIDYDLRHLEFGEHEQQPELLELNPLHTMPTLEDNGLALYESRAILAYLAAAYGEDDTLYPQDIRKRALVDQRVQFDLGTLHARYYDYAEPVMFAGAPVDESKKEKIITALGFFDLMLKGHTFAAINHFTIADLTLTVTVAQLEMIKIDLEPFKRVCHWLERCKNHLSEYGYDDIQQPGAELAGVFLENAGIIE